ncbi:MAG: DUF951 domain-containing protein [Anaerolineae bacterium]|nr:DUF951 domain-containing protein [Anaerolineae bacterium]
MPMNLQVGDVVRLRKVHPCGGYEWDIVRIGADIGLKCRACGRRILEPRSKIEKQIKSIISSKSADA